MNSENFEWILENLKQTVLSLGILRADDTILNI